MVNNRRGSPKRLRKRNVSEIGCCHELARKAYYGGRVEVFRAKHDASEGPLYYGDVNSMYPWAMLQPMPVSDVAYFRGDCDYRKLSRFRIGFIDCEVEIPRECYLPPLPYRYEGKLIFPCGKLRGVWDYAELANLGRIGGRITKIHSSIWLSRKVVFAEYVHTLYKLRDKSQPDYSEPVAFLAKLMMNSLYGKFGMSEEREKVHLSPSDDLLSSGALTPMFSSENDIFLETVICTPSYVIPQISAHITALARVRLWELMMECLEAGHKIYYCDTDSIISTFPFSHSTKLGEIKLEDEIVSATFARPKLYCYVTPAGKSKARAKGFSRGFGGDSISAEDVSQILSGGSIQSKTMSKARSVLRSEAGPELQTREKRLRGEYTKRTLLPDGNTRPLVIGGSGAIQKKAKQGFNHPKR